MSQACSVVAFGTMEIHNVDGSSTDKRAKSWIAWWWEKTSQKYKKKCYIAGCGERKNLVGGHVELVKDDGWWYMLPICSKHNAKKYDRTTPRGAGDTMITAGDGVAVRFPVHPAHKSARPSSTTTAASSDGMISALGGSTHPLHAAAAGVASRTDASEIVISKSTDLTAETDGQTAYQIAWSQGCGDLAIKLRKAANAQSGPEGLTLLHEAAKVGNSRAVASLLKKCGANSNLRCGKKGKTALHYAVQNEFVEVVELLLKHNKFLVNTPQSSGFTALDYAVHNNSVPIARLLLKYGADRKSAREDAMTLKSPNREMMSVLSAV